MEGVAAFAEPIATGCCSRSTSRPDRLYGLITHELTHVFQFDIIPQSLVRRQAPLWMSEGQADDERGSGIRST